MNNLGDAKVPSCNKTVFVIVDIEGPLRIEADQSLTVRPILRSHLQVPHFKGIHDPIHPVLEAGPGRFHIHARLMRIGQNRDPFLLPFQFDKKRFCARQKADHMTQLPVHRHDIDAYSFGPVLQVRPGQLTFDRSIHRHQPIARVLERMSVQDGIATRQFLLEKEVVEVPVEQRAVHIEQDVVDVVPIDRERCHPVECT